MKNLYERAVNDGRSYFPCHLLRESDIHSRYEKCLKEAQKITNRIGVDKLEIMRIFVTSIATIAGISEKEVIAAQQVRDMIELIPENVSYTFAEFSIRRFLTAFSGTILPIASSIKSVFLMAWTAAEEEFQSNGWDLAFINLEEAFSHLLIINGYKAITNANISLPNIRPRLNLFLVQAESEMVG